MLRWRPIHTARLATVVWIAAATLGLPQTTRAAYQPSTSAVAATPTCHIQSEAVASPAKPRTNSRTGEASKFMAMESIVGDGARS